MIALAERAAHLKAIEKTLPPNASSVSATGVAVLFVPWGLEGEVSVNAKQS